MVHLPTALFSLSYIRDSSNRCSHYAPLRGATVVTRTVTEGAAEFQSTRPARGATHYTGNDGDTAIFQSTRPARGATSRLSTCWKHHHTFQSTRPARGATKNEVTKSPEAKISIHAPREGRDCHNNIETKVEMDFNPRAPRGARLAKRVWDERAAAFQSTRPARGATGGQGGIPSQSPYFNPRAPRGARRNQKEKKKQDSISIHAPREGRDVRTHVKLGHNGCISIHAPREGRDWETCAYTARYIIFQSTRPARGATEKFNCFTGHRFISIHAPREGRDAVRINPSFDNSRFQSTRPARGATRAFLRTGKTTCISIHAPREGRDSRGSGIFFIRKLFQSTRPARGATAKVNKFLCTFLQKRHGFQISLRKTLPFKAFCRLQIGKNFSICGANRCGNFCELLLRTIRSSVLPEGRSACSQNAQFYSHTFSRDNRNADCLFPGP